MATVPVLSDLDFGQGTRTPAARLTNVPDAVAAQEPVTLAQLNAAVEGLAWKDSVRVAAPANVNLAAPGATLDGITMAAGDRFLAPNQTTTTQRGIYIWNGAAAAATRAPDASTGPELEGAVVTVEEGTSAGATFRQTTVNFTIDVGSPAFTTFGTSAPAASETTAGIAELATQAETDTGTDDARIVTPLKLATYANRAKRFSSTIGDGAATSYTVTHNLGTDDCEVYVREAGGSKRVVITEVQDTSVNSVTVLFSAAPALNSMRVTVLA